MNALISTSSKASSSSTSLGKLYVPLLITHIMNICCITNSLHLEASFNGACRIATKGQARYVFNKIATKTSLACMQRIFSTDNEEDFSVLSFQYSFPLPYDFLCIVFYFEQFGLAREHCRYIKKIEPITLFIHSSGRNFKSEALVF